MARLMLLELLLVFLAVTRGLGQNTTHFDWNALQPSDTFNWTDCNGGFQCAKLSVPLNYSDPDGDKAAIAVIRLKSALSTDDPNYRGPIFFNPGGPGGSGVDFLLTEASRIQNSVNFTSFDLVSFDPRGVGYTTPKAAFCIDSSVYPFSLDDNNVNSTTPMFQIPRLWAYSQTLGHFAKNSDPDGRVLAHVSTDNVARDMWQMVQAYNQTKLQYYGASYGTVLGATFATLFPDKIERMVLDGVVNSTAYFTGDWAQELLTTEKGLQNFFDSCHAAGPTGCAFYDSEPSKIAARLDDLLDSIYQQPLPVYPDLSSGVGDYGIVDYAVVRQVILGALYDPYPGFSQLSETLAALEKGNVSLLPLNTGSTGSECPGNGSDALNSFETFVAIHCSDLLVENRTAEDLIQYYQNNRHISSFLNEFMRNTIICSGWQFHPPGRLTGPVGGNTSAPILFIGNTFDPVTPLAAAFETSMAFPGSGVLTQDSPGHTSLAAPSSCTLGHIAQYIADGTLPGNGTVCPVDASPFNSTSSNVKTFKILNHRHLSRSATLRT